MKLVVITGCLGLIGHHITRHCLSLGYKVYGIDKLTYAANYQFLDELCKHKNFKFKEADIATLDYLPDCDYVINTAAESHVGNSPSCHLPFYTKKNCQQRQLYNCCTERCSP